VSEKLQVNKILIGIVIVAALCLLLVMCRDKREAYKPLEQSPDYSQDSEPKDGDTQADTIKALQAFAKEAVDRADALNKKTEGNMQQVIETKNNVNRLQIDNKEHKENVESNRRSINELIGQLNELQMEVVRLKDEASKASDGSNEGGLSEPFSIAGLPADPEKGDWHYPVEYDAAAGDKGKKFSSLLSRSIKQTEVEDQSVGTAKTDQEKVRPAYTIAKDTTLMNATVMTAMIGRIPVDGTTPDPYPLKILIGKDNLAANGLELPGIEGMIFSGLAFGDWNLSCVRAQLYSASFIFPDGTIVNHTESAKPLAHITDPYGNCITGKFITNAPAFLAQQSLLGGLSAAGAAYAEAQTVTQTSALTGTSTSTLVGSISDKVLGEVVEDTTEEIQQWFLERQKQSFDAVVVAPGASVVVHIEKELPIDHIKEGRRTTYASGSKSSTSDLD
jgi:integrating conjugative element protein (TIGR03752 family)